VARLSARAGLLALLAVFAGLLLGACGGSSDSTSSDELTNDEYAAQVQTITGSFAAGFDQLSADAANPTSPEDFRAAVVAIQDRITETVDDLDAITPPADLADLHEQLVQVFADYRDGYDPIVEALDADDQKALQDAAAQIPTVVQDFQTTYTEIKTQMADAGVTIEATDTGSASADSTSSTGDSSVPAY
jgi:major membrane immunogen (membrane-anchored lipoprotein)